MTNTWLPAVLALIDQANSLDPNTEVDETGAAVPKELIYGRRMSEMLARFAPEADAVAQAAVRAQHIQRWTVPRSQYPMDKVGYHQWRTGLYRVHADLAAGLARQAGADEASVERIAAAVGKRNLKGNADTQLLEDVASLVFIEHYMLPFAGQKPDYSEEKWVDIIAKTWRKMSDRAHRFALEGGIRLPEPLLPLIGKALNPQ
ncbi:MAG: DUF4202 domain-containing protein [Rhodocyclaceae bacterium]|nr:MAG: DUF4202 domain-containing protein [Rhodocyclaceae bacterium]